MKINARTQILFLTLALLPLASPAAAQSRDTIHVEPAAGSRVWIDGGSNVRDWSCRATTFDARAIVDAPSSSSHADPVISRVSVKLNARDLKCGNRKMERDLYAALKATDEANPSYIIAVFDAVDGSSDTTALTTRGTLTVAGVEQTVKVVIAIERMSDGALKATGNVPLRMTDFGVKPPTGMLGLIRSKNEIVVKFELLIPGPG